MEAIDKSFGDFSTEEQKQMIYTSHVDTIVNFDQRDASVRVTEAKIAVGEEEVDDDRRECNNNDISKVSEEKFDKHDLGSEKGIGDSCVDTTVASIEIASEESTETHSEEDLDSSDVAESISRLYHQDSELSTSTDQSSLHEKKSLCDSSVSISSSLAETEGVSLSCEDSLENLNRRSIYGSSNGRCVSEDYVDATDLSLAGNVVDSSFDEEDDVFEDAGSDVSYQGSANKFRSFLRRLSSKVTKFSRDGAAVKLSSSPLGRQSTEKLVMVASPVSTRRNQAWSLMKERTLAQATRTKRDVAVLHRSRPGNRL